MRRCVERINFRCWLVCMLMCLALVARAVAQNDAPAAADSDASRGKYYALVIGINEYTAPIPQLSTAVGDAQAMGKVLHDTYGFDTKLLLNAEATREHIFAALSHYEVALRENDSLLIYYAGHGFQNKVANKAYWLPVDANSMQSSNRISADDLTTEMATLRAKHVLVISDSCYSGGLTRSLDDPALSKGQDAFLRKMLEGRSRNLMASGGDEPVADGGPEGHSVFAYAVLKSLENQDQSMFTASDLFYGAVQRRVAGNSTQIPQYAPIRNSGDDNGDFVFRRMNITAREEQHHLTAAATGFQRSLALYNSKQYAEASRSFAADCDSGIVRGCFALGVMYDNAQGVAEDFVKAVSLYRKSCDGKDASGCANLGYMYEYGKGITVSKPQAAVFYKKGCDGGNGHGCTNIANLYEDGDGVAKDLTQAAALYRKACDSDDGRGCSRLGLMYEQGRGVAKDAVEADKLYAKACDADYARGCTYLGLNLVDGLGITKDVDRAAVLFRKACDAGHGKGCTSLGVAYREGRGLPADPDMAAKFYRKACDSDDPNGCVSLGVMTENGAAMPADPAKANQLYAKACEADDGRGCQYLGMNAAAGTGMDKDVAKAKEFLGKGCKLEQTESCNLLKKLQ